MPGEFQVKSAYKDLKRDGGGQILPFLFQEGRKRRSSPLKEIAVTSVMAILPSPPLPAPFGTTHSACCPRQTGHHMEEIHAG